MEEFGRYQLIRRLGTGGMAEVFLARTPLAQGLHKLLVIKKIHPAHASSSQFRVMFRHEAEAAMNLNHPNIAQVFEWGELPSYYLAMEYVEGVDLLRLLQFGSQSGRRLPYGLAAYVVQQMAKGLDYAHRKLDPQTSEPLGIVHRDISPQNVLVSLDGAVKLVDFGIAALRGAPEEEGVVKGKYAYMSPEQAEGRTVDRRSDIFSAGVVLYELATARPLFGALGGERALESIRRADVPRPRSLDPELPAELEQIILQALRRDPAQRFQTARDLHKALTRFFFDLGSRDEVVYDSSALAAFCAQTIPTETRRLAAPPPAAAAAGSAAPPRRASVVVPTPPQAETPTLRERKHVLVVEGELQGLQPLRRSVGEQRAREALLDFLRVAEHIAYKRHAHSDRLDEGGFSYLIGLPAAREDDAAGAIRLARDLKEALDGISRDLAPPLSLGIGIMRGVAEVTRHPSGFEHQLLGPTSQVVRRLAREAMAGEILCGGGVYRVARDEWHFDEIDTIDVPPETGEMPAQGRKTAKVYRLRGPKERHERLEERLPSAPFGFVGRQAELAQLLDSWREAQERSSARYVAIVGETGLGKRSLVSAFLSQVPLGQAAILRAQGRRSMSETPFALVADLARDFLGIGDEAEPREIRKRVEAALALLFPGGEGEVEAREVATMIALLLGVKMPGMPDDIDPTERQHRLFRAMDRVGDRMAQQLPLIVVIEEMHWADPQSLEMLRALVMLPRPRPVLGITTARPDPHIREVLQGIEAPLRRIVELRELDQREREALVMGRFGHDEAVRPLCRELLARAGGNPFYLHELIESLLERGVLGQAEDAGRLRWVQRDAPLSVPTTVEAVVASRLDALSPGERETLLRAAVLGRRVVPSDLSALLGRDAAGDLDRLVHRHLLTRDDKGGYAFYNQILHEVAYAAVPEDEKRELHRRAARLFGGREGARPELGDAELARHAAAGGEREQAVRRYLAAARAALDLAANKLAFDHLRNARGLLEPGDEARRFEIAAELEHLLRAFGKRAAQLREIHAMRRAAEAVGDSGRLAQAFVRMARFDYEIGRILRAKREAERALELARAAVDRAAEVHALRLLALTLASTGEAREALERISLALALCEEPAEPSASPPAGTDGAPELVGAGNRRAGRERLLLRAAVMNARGTILHQTGQAREAVEAYAEAMVIYRRLGVRSLEAAALGNLGLASAGLGEYDEALGYYKRALAIDQEIGNRAALGSRLAALGQAYLDLGDFELAERTMRKALELHRALEERAQAAAALVTLGQIHLRRGELTPARQALEGALAAAVETADRHQEIRALVHLARLRLAEPDGAATALELAERASRLAAEAQTPQGQLWGLGVWALALVGLGRAEEAALRSAEAVALLEARSELRDREELLHLHSRVLAAAGRAGEAAEFARRAYEEVQARARRLRHPELRARYLSAPPACDITREVESSGGRPLTPAA